jgi:hypothetical protein
MDDVGTVEKMVLAFVRHALTTVAGSMIAAGTISQAQSEALIGGLLALVAIAWSLWDKHKTVKLNAAKNEIIMDQQAVIQAKTAEISTLK